MLCPRKEVRKLAGKDNLKPPSSTEEARERGRKGGIKSGEARRRKRDARSAARMILNLPASEINEHNLRAMGIDPSDFTNIVAVMARAFSKAMTGDVSAMNFLLETAAITPRAKMAEEYAERTNPVIAKYGNSVFGDR